MAGRDLLHADCLGQLLLAQRPAGFLAAEGAAGPRTWSDFLHQVSAVATWLNGKAAQSCLLLAEDCYKFAVGFFAAARAGCSIILPSSLKPGHVAQVAGQADAVVADQPLTDLHLPQYWPWPAPEPGPSVLDPVPLDLNAVRVLMHTSGSTGMPQRVLHSLRSLSAEVATLESSFGAELGDCRVMGTVPPYHIYGLLHRILWPLAAGRTIVRGTIRLPLEVPHQLGEGEAPICLVASPAFLTRAVPLLDLGRLSAALRAVFSSGGPLPPETGAAVNGAGVPLWEIYGSTETGGIAHRRVITPSAPPAWCPFPQVQVSRDEETEQLVVRSPHMDAAQPFLCGDKISPPNDKRQFFLRGRADRVVKIEDRRLSLDELEQSLLEAPEVAAIRFLPVEQHGHVSLGAAVVPSEAGWSLMENDGRPALVKRLSQHLAHRFVASAVPRRWRFLGALPVNAQGKCSTEDLLPLFQDSPENHSRPAIREARDLSGDTHLALVFDLPRDMVFFDGHFAEAPILPGVVQVDWAIGYGRERFDIPGRFLRLEAIKFFRILTPGTRVQLELRYDTANSKLYFEYSSLHGRHASGRIQFEAAA